MKYKIGDVVQIVKVTYCGAESPEDYIDQIVIIRQVESDFGNYVVEFSDNFKGERCENVYSDCNLIYPSKDTLEKLIWDKLKLIADDISKLKETPDDRLRDIYYTIKNYN